MKYLFIILISVWLSSCLSTEHEISRNSAGDFKTLDTIIPFSGFWLNEVYLKNINKTKSPRECQGLSESCIEIPSRTLQETSMISGFHEGAAAMVVLKNQDKFQFYYKYDDTIRNVAYDIQIISKDKIKIGNNIFIKTDMNFLGDILFSGDYLDSLGTQIQFLKNGLVTGLDKFTIYDPIYDYVDPGMEVDQISFGETLEKMKPYGFRFSQDTLLIYNLNCLVFDSTNNECSEVAFGDIKYKLTKIH